jgi:hypothetical protein
MVSETEPNVTFLHASSPVHSRRQAEPVPAGQPVISVSLHSLLPLQVIVVTGVGADEHGVGDAGVGAGAGPSASAGHDPLTSFTFDFSGLDISLSMLEHTLFVSSQHTSVFPSLILIFSHTFPPEVLPSSHFMFTVEAEASSDLKSVSLQAFLPLQTISMVSEYTHVHERRKDMQ